MAKDAAPPLLPTASLVVGAAKARLVEVRPGAAPHINSGNWATPFIGLRGQFVVANARLAEEARAARLGTASGEALTQLAESNHDTPRATTSPVAGIGLVTLTRSVVHYLPFSALRVTAPNATSEATLTALLTDVRAVFNAHAASVYSSGTGAGAHRVEETVLLSVPVVALMGDIVATLNDYKSTINAHFANASLGASAKPHVTADEANVVGAADAWASDGAGAYSGQSAASQQSALVLATALKTALNAHFGLRALAGTIRRGTRFRVEPDTVAVPPIAGGEYEATQDAYVSTGAWYALVRVLATATGPAQNIPGFSPVRPVTVTTLGSLYDAAETLRFAPTAITCAGGTNGQPDSLLREAARAGWQGSYGPTDAALVAGALRFPGLASCPVLKDANTGASVLYAVDETWAQSETWLEALVQYVSDEWLGVGCRARAGAVVNRVVRIEATVVLRQRTDLNDTTAIEAAVRAEVERYFSARPDWWMFRLGALRAVCSFAHDKILKCPTVLVLDSEGAPVAEPSQPAAGEAITHWWFAGGLSVVFDAPS